MATSTTLEDLLRQALNHLYDSTFLRDSPLVGLLGLSHHPNRARALRTTLEAAIEALGDLERPTAADGDERTYDVLFHRYLQQFTQVDVANQLGISTRHLRREQAHALQVLADYMADKYHLPDIADAPESTRVVVADATSVASELLWLQDSMSQGSAQVDELIAEALHTARPLAAAHGVTLGQGATMALPRVAVDRTILKQILLNLLATGIEASPSATVAVTAKAQNDRVLVQLTVGAGADVGHPQWLWDDAKVTISRQLATKFGGQLAIHTDGPLLTLAVSLPCEAQVRVLAIEDNHDTLELWRRYLENTRFQVQAVRDPQETLWVAERDQPQIILLDVMLPGTDGWELLSRLRHHPPTASIPVVVCTVLPQRELALSLGASGFVGKPTSRESLIEALARQSGA